MPIITTQPTTPQTNQKPIVYQVSGAATTKVQVATATFTQANGTVTTAKQQHSLPNGTNFEHDLSGIVRDALNKDIHKTFNYSPFTVKAALDRTGNLVVVFQDYNEVTNADGTFLEADPSTASSTAVPVINALITDNQLDAAYSNGSLPLSKKRVGRFCRGERNIITLWNQGGGAVVSVTSHNPSGNTTANVSGLTTNAINEINVAHPILVNENAVAITINFANTSIYLKKECCTAALIHFINSFGQVETASFTRLFRQNKPKSDQFESMLPVAATSSDIGVGRYNIQRRVIYEATLGNLKKEEVDWLHDLMDSPAAVWQVGTTLVPVVVLDGRFEDDITEGETIFSIKFELARGKAGLV